MRVQEKTEDRDHHCTETFRTQIKVTLNNVNSYRSHRGVIKNMTKRRNWENDSVAHVKL